MQNVVVLVGGVGGAKLAHGLAQILPPERLTIIVNTADDFWLYGLRICPDLDTVMYTLADVVDKTNGWGIAGDTHNMLDAFARLGESTWFGLGDQDVATHLLRTRELLAAEPLTAVTQHLTKALGIRHAILPMTDTPVATKLDTVELGELDFQVYFVRERWQPRLRGIRFDGIERAVISAEVARAIDNADVILVGPSNPWLSIAPILAVPGLRERLVARDVPRVALTPIVQGDALKGPAAKLMAELGYEVSPRGVAAYYGDTINGFVADERDQPLVIDGLRTTAMDTIMRNDADRAVLAQKLLEWITSWGVKDEHLGDHSGQAANAGQKPAG